MEPISIFLFFYFVIFLVLSPLILCIVAWGYIYPLLFWGAIYVPTTEEKIKKMVEILGLKPGQIVVDLGAGDARLIISLAKAGAKAYGYEINPLLVERGRMNIINAGLYGRAFISFRNLWRVNLKNFDAVVIYPMEHMMKGLERKFEKELKPGAKVVSNHFTLPTWKPDKVEDGVYLYIKK